MILPGFPDGPEPALMIPEGSGANGVCVVGEALGRNEEIDRLPFRPYAEAGSVLERAFRLARVDRQSFLISNVVWYRPPNDWLENAPWEYDAIAACRPMNERLFRERQPRCFLALGGVAMRELTGMAGHRQGILLARGFPIRSKYDIPCVGSYHPSYLRRGAKDEDKESGARIEGAAGRGMDLLGVLIRDIQLAVAIGRAGWTYEPESAAEYLEHASLADLANFYNDAAAHPDLPISWDIETRDTLEAGDDESETVVREFSDIYQIQFSLRPKQATILDWQDSEPFHKLICAILALPNPKLDFNGRKTDRPITKRFLRDKGYELAINGDCHDLMDCWHHAQPDLPKGLQHVASFYCPEIGPWKHLDLSRPHFYGGRDVDAPQRIFCKLSADLRKLGIWKGYERHILRLSPILDRMTARGIPVNDAERIEFGHWLDGQKILMENEAQALVPEEVRAIHPKEGYKRLPPDLRGWLAQSPPPIHGGLCDPVTLPSGKQFVLREFRDVDQLKLIDVPTYRWCELLPFNPNSSQQLMSYIRFKREQEIAAYVAKGHVREKAEQRAKYKIPRNRKEQKDTTDKREILALGKRTGDPIFGKIVQYREFGKLRGTYVDGWSPAADGRVHPSFGFAPATGQLSSSDPNAQNIPSEKSRGAAGSASLIALAARFRAMLEAPAGYTLIEADFKSFHALTLGFVAQDASYMRLARLDIHSFFAAVGLLRIAKSDDLLAKPDDELLEYLAWVKTKYPVVRDGQAKPAVLGYGLGMRGQTLWDQNPESFSSRREADDVLRKLDDTFPIAAAWRRSILTQANNQKYLVTPHGYIRRFWDVFSNKPVKDNYRPSPGERMFIHRGDAKDTFWKVGHGTDAEAAISLLVQNAGHGHLKDNMLAIDEKGWAERYGMCNTVHDALWFCCLDSLAEECAVNVKTQMELPSRVLVNPVAPDGLWCAVDVSIGRNMQKREKFQICQKIA